MSLRQIKQLFLFNQNYVLNCLCVLFLYAFVESVIYNKHRQKCGCMFKIVTKLLITGLCNVIYFNTTNIRMAKKQSIPIDLAFIFGKTKQIIN